VLTSPKQGTARDRTDTVEGVTYYRTGQPAGRVPVLVELSQMLKMAARISAVARKERPSILQAHSPVLNGLPALWAGRRLRLPMVYEARAFWEDAAVDHGTTRADSLRYRVSRALETWVFRRADRVITICEGMRHDIIGRGVDEQRVAVVPNGVDVEWFRSQPPNSELARSLRMNGGPVFGFVGSFYRYEGLRFLLDAVPALRRELPTARVLLVGTGEQEPALRVAAAGLGDAVIFAGQVPHDQVRDFYSLIDVFVCPRRRMRLTETVTPLKPLEAMAMGRAVLASDVGGLVELVEHEVTGLVFHAESVESFVAEAARLGRDRSLRQRLGDAARRLVERERSWEQIGSRWVTLYAELGAERGRRLDV
jgi:PEP-CTERM/exosortase A-associated glycosyltransferase